MRRPLLAIAFLCHAALAQQPAVDKSKPERFAKAVADFEEADRQTPPPKNAILFVGSSIFRSWKTVGQQMAPMPVINRAIGGSRTADQLYWMDRLVFPYAPRMVVYYCGSNDLNANKTPAEIFAGFREFADRVRAKLPATRVFYVSINRAPQKRKKWEELDAANTLVKTHCARTPGLAYIDVNPALFGPDGEPRTELYLKDGLHFEGSSYEEFAKIIKPILEQAWKEK